MTTALEFAGNYISRDGVQPRIDRLAPLRKLTLPTTRQALKQTVALFRSLRTYIPGYDAVITSLTSILDHSNHKMEMRGEAHEAFHLILSHLLTKPWLGHIRPTGQFHLYVDAPLGGARNNRQGIGAALFKESWGIRN